MALFELSCICAREFGFRPMNAVMAGTNGTNVHHNGFKLVGSFLSLRIKVGTMLAA